MTPETVAVVLVIVALVVTRLWEERRWRAGKLGDRTAAVLVVGRLPVFVLAFTLIRGMDPVTTVGSTGVALALAAALYQPVVGRLRRSRLKSRG